MSKEKDVLAERKPMENFITNAALHNAVCIKNGWAKGKVMSEKEYKDAVDAFLNSPSGSFRGKK